MDSKHVSTQLPALTPGVHPTQDRASGNMRVPPTHGVSDTQNPRMRDKTGGGTSVLGGP